MRVCMLAYTFYESDNRVMRYAETLAARGDHVDVLSLRQSDDAPIDVIKGVRVHHIQRREHNERGKLSYLGRMLKFLARSSWLLTKEHTRQHYDLIHVHSVPDFEVFAALFPKLLGAKVILDIHDLVPEFYASKFGVSKHALSFKILKLVERWSAAFSDHVIIANHLWEKVLIERAVAPAKCSTYLNYPDSSLFNTSLRTRNDDGRIIMMYPGTLNWHQGLDIAVKAFDLIKDDVPEAEFHVYGDGGTKQQLVRIVEERKLQNRVKLMGGRPIRDIAGIMANADIGIVPKRDDAFGGEAFSTKIFEFMALGVPVIAANTRIDRYYFNDSIIKFFQAGDEKSLATAMINLIRDPCLRKDLAAKALTYVAQQSWDIKRQDYLDLVDRLVKGTPA
jgi:glycosyltransferase involved in cell wall biosynthesis